MDIKALMQQLDALELKRANYHYAQSVIYFDGMTVAPKKSVSDRSNCFALLAEEQYKLFFNDEVGSLLSDLYSVRDQLDAPARRRVELLKEEYDKNFRIPMDEYIDFQVLVNEADAVWHDAKATNDYAMFEPYLIKVFDTLKRFAGYMEPEKEPYNVWLGEHEKGLTRETCDAFFNELKEGLVPLIHKVNAAPQLDTRCVDGNFSVEQQRELSAYLMDLMILPRDRTAIGEVDHPFCCGASVDDVRISTHYYEDNLLSSMFSVIHESGHALYELGSDPAFRNTAISSPNSTSVHESQSRFFENCICRSKEFASFILPKLKEIFPVQFADVTADQFFKAINKSEPSLIRIEADELTYSLHILIRYELEKQLFDGKLTTADLPAAWNRLYKEYLGVDVPNDAKGVLQDTHWSNALVGYFPSYALGSAYAAQMLDAMQRDLDVFGFVAKGDFAPIVRWLDERVHKLGGMPLALEVVESATGKPFSAKYYIDYLTKKYTEIYHLA